MSGRGKRLWAPRLSFTEAYREVLDFLKNCQKHNLVSSSGGVPTLFQVYQMDTSWPTEGLIDATTVLRFGYDRNPIGDQAKQAMARLLAVVTKAHFFLAPDAIVTHEPYLFLMPDLGNPGQRRYGLIYPLESAGRTTSLVVAEWDLGTAASRNPNLPFTHKFPVVLPAEPMQWVPLKHWRALKETVGASRWFDTNNPNARSRLFRELRQHEDVSTFPYGHVLDYPKDLNDDLKAVGAIWASGVRKWFLPSGWDVKAVTDYLDRLVALSPMDRYQLRWTAPAAYPKAVAGSGDAD